MILRRLTKHVEDQNWFAVALDFLIVVLGVFLGIQIGNWNTDSAQNRQAAELERQLVLEMAGEALNYRGRLIYFRDVQAIGEAVLADAEGTAVLADQDYIIKAFRATQYNTHIKTRYAFDKIVADGLLDRIKDRTLMIDADNYYTLSWVQVAEEETRASTYRRLFRETVPLDVQRDARGQCGDANMPALDSYAAATVFYEADYALLDYPCKLSLPAERIAAAAKALREAQGLAPALRFRIAEMDNTNALMAVVDDFMVPWRMTPEDYEKATREASTP